MKSETPRTDAEFKLEAFFDGSGIVETVFVEFARELETELAESRAEIERKDKLIELMLEALRLALSEARSTHCENTIKAALAAEGGKKK